MAGETLRITDGNAAGQDIGLEQELVIGRLAPGAGSLAGDPEISREHARVFRDPSGRLVVEDLGSTNGTFVNGTRISAPQALSSGDELRMGRSTMSVAGGGAPAPADPPTQALPPAPPPAARGGGPSRNLLIGLAAALVVALVVAGLAIGGVFSGSDSKSKTSAQPQTSPVPTQTVPSQVPGGGYSPTFKNSFVASCAKSGSLSKSQCRCIINKAQAQYSLAQFINAVGQAQKGSTPPKLRQLFLSCANA